MKLHDILSERELLAADMCEMANLYPQTTGLPLVIWFGEVGGQHGPRIKVSNNKGKMTSNDCFVVAVSKMPVILTPNNVRVSQSEINDVMDWIVVNYDTLMKMWTVHETGDGDLVPLLQQLQKI